MDGPLIREDAGTIFLRETGEELDELTGNGIEELLMTKGGRFFVRGQIEECCLAGKWRPVGALKVSEEPSNERRFVYEDTEITRAEAREWMFDNIIPSQMWDDFKPKPPKWSFVELESSIYQVNSLLYLFACQLGEELEQSWPEIGGNLASGVQTLCHRASDDLTGAFTKCHNELSGRMADAA